jgi:microcin C transport system permease protein
MRRSTAICPPRRPPPPTWWLSDAQCQTVAVKTGGTGCRDIEWNWLGTDDRGRDVVARLIYGFRISVLFGLILAVVASTVGIAGRRGAGLFRRLD